MLYTHLAWADGRLALSMDPASGGELVRAVLDSRADDPLAEVALEVRAQAEAETVLAYPLATMYPDFEITDCVQVLVASEKLLSVSNIWLQPSGDPEAIRPGEGEALFATFEDPIFGDDYVRVPADFHDERAALIPNVPEMTFGPVWSCG